MRSILRAIPLYLAARVVRVKNAGAYVGGAPLWADFVRYVVLVFSAARWIHDADLAEFLRAGHLLVDRVCERFDAGIDAQR